MEEKRKRGRPRKLPELIVELVVELQIVEQPKKLWDVSTNDEILFFDKNLSYELTGYKPINNKEGLDFRPDWFTEARETFKRTGHYCGYRPKTKAYRDFWNLEYDRCKNGMTVNGYTITGDHYFFLNYYQLNNTAKLTKAMDAVTKDFPDFIVALYEYLHYLELCKRLRKNAVLMKARGLGRRPSINSAKSVKAKMVICD